MRINSFWIKICFYFNNDFFVIFQRLKSEIEDPPELEEALESLHSNYSKKVVSEFTELQNSAANDLKEKSQLSEEEVIKLTCLILYITTFKFVVNAKLNFNSSCFFVCRPTQL